MRCLSEGSPRRGRGGKAAQPEARGKTQREEARQLTFAELLGQRPFNQVVSHISRHPGGRREVRRKGTCQSHPGNPVQTAPQPTTPSGTCRRPEPPHVRCAKRSSRSVGKHRLGQGHAHPALHVCPDFRDPLKRVVPLPPPPTSPTLEFPHLAPWEASPRGPGFSQPPRRALLP